MHERILRDFFLGHVDGGALSEDLSDSIVQMGSNETGIGIIDLQDGEHNVTPEDLLKVCDSVLQGQVEPWKLEPIGFCLIASDYFCCQADSPSGSRAARVIAMWANPEINYPLTLKMVEKAKHLLLTGANTFTDAELSNQAGRSPKPRRVSKIFKDEVH
jgi:hypothetical protein